MLQNYTVLFGLIEILGKKWIVPLLLILLFCEKSTFTKIKKQLGLTSRALSKKLKLLETMGLVEKIAESPRNVIYMLSGKGREIAQSLLGFAENFPKA